MKIIQFSTDNREQQKDYENPLPHFGTAPEALLEGFTSIPDVEVHVVSCVRSKVSIPERIFGNIHYHPVLVPKTGWMSTFYYGCIRATSRLVREIAPDIVHGQGTERECAMNAIYSGVPNVVTIHGNMAELNRLGNTFQGAPVYGFLASQLETHALRKTGGVFCNSAYTESLVAPHARKSWRVPNAIRAQFFRKPKRLPVASEVPIILNVGHLGPNKRQLEILKMASEMHVLGHAFKLIFLGAMSEDSRYGKAFVEELKHAEALGYACHGGFLDADELIDLMDQAHGMIHFPLAEAFGLVVAEAMARGLKFFGANLGGIVDIASGIDGAELHNDFESLQTGIINWLDAGAPAPAKAADEIARRYHPKVIAERHLEIYREVLRK